jgi:hypothetical protein
MLHSTNYLDTFIEIADDCPVTAREIPPQRGRQKTVANLQFEMLVDSPYRYTSDDILFTLYAIKNNVLERDLDTERIKFFSRGQPCFRSSPLPKRYGWGVHSDSDGRIAIYAVNSEEYQRLAQAKDVKHVKAMRSKRARG